MCHLPEFVVSYCVSLVKVVGVCISMLMRLMATHTTKSFYFPVLSKMKNSLEQQMICWVLRGQLVFESTLYSNSLGGRYRYEGQDKSICSVEALE